MAYEKKKDDRSLRELKEHIKNKELKSLYVFSGEESYLKEHYKNEIEKLILTEGFGEFNVINLDASDMKENDLSDAVEGLPFGGDKKLVIIRDLNLSACGAKIRDILAPVFAEPPEYLCLILYYQAIEYKPDKRQNIFKSLEKNGLVVDFNKADGSELVKWLQRRFSALGKTMSPRDCEYLIYICGSLMTNLVTEIEKLASYEQGEIITREDIDAVASRVLDADVFDLTDCIMSGDHKKGVAIFRDLMEMKNEPVAVLGAIIRQSQRIYAASLARKAGKDESYLAKLFGFRSSYPARLLVEAAGRTSVERAAKALEICCNADTELKSNIPDPERVLELVLLRMAQVKA